MAIYELFDFGDARRVSEKFMQASVDAEPIRLRGAMHEIAFDMMRAEQILFRSQGRRGGGSWAHLKEETERKKGNSRILFTSGSKPGYSDPGNNTLYRSLTVTNAPYQVLTIAGYELEFGTDRPYAYVHQVGGGNKGGVPARPFLKFTLFDRKRWLGIVEKHLLRSFSLGTAKAPFMSLNADTAFQLQNILSKY
jgi:phage gpG-like protein